MTKRSGKMEHISEILRRVLPLKLDNVREPDLKKLSDQVTTWLKAKYAGKCT